MDKVAYLQLYNSNQILRIILSSDRLTTIWSIGEKTFWKEEKKNAGKNNYSYSTKVLNRFQMLYCSHTNRNSGLFRKSTFQNKF
jgi:hypothetical protein